ncbi:MAG: GMC oxidoreductase [Pseudomonadota bacterium]
MAWPISHESLAGYQRTTYESLGFGIEQQDDDHVWSGIGKVAPSLGEELEVFLTRWLGIPNFAQRFSDQIHRDDTISLLLNHTVTGFSFDGARVNGLAVMTPHGEVRDLAARVIVLAAGTIESVRILLHAARLGSGNCPWRHNENVGRYFADHIGGRAAEVKPLEGFQDAFSTIVLNKQKYAPKLRYKDQLLERNLELNIQGFFSFEGSISENLAVLKQFVKSALYSREIKGVLPLTRNLVGCARYLPPLMWRYLVDNRIFLPSGSTVSFMVQAEQPASRFSRIEIDPNDLDSYGLPRVLLDWQVDSERVLQGIYRFVSRADDALRASDLAELAMVAELAEHCDDYLRLLRDTSHQSGGAVMSRSARTGVVDENLRVYGTENLFVCGAATFPTVSNANTTFLALTLATRLGEHLARFFGR